MVLCSVQSYSSVKVKEMPLQMELGSPAEGSSHTCAAHYSWQHQQKDGGEE